jgi:hypothetical protein
MEALQVARVPVPQPLMSDSSAARTSFVVGGGKEAHGVHLVLDLDLESIGLQSPKQIGLPLGLGLRGPKQIGLLLGLGLWSKKKSDSPLDSGSGVQSKSVSSLDSDSRVQSKSGSSLDSGSGARARIGLCLVWTRAAPGLLARAWGFAGGYRRFSAGIGIGKGQPPPQDEEARELKKGRWMYGWMPHNASFGFLDLTPSILLLRQFWD